MQPKSNSYGLSLLTYSLTHLITSLHAPSLNLADFSVLLKSIAIVSGPTPPGTGV